MASKFKTGFKVVLLLLLASLIMLPANLFLMFFYNLPVYFVLLVISLVVLVFVYGFLFNKFKKWIFK
jgi:hypothetical protein